MRRQELPLAHCSFRPMYQSGCIAVWLCCSSHTWLYFHPLYLLYHCSRKLHTRRDFRNHPTPVCIRVSKSCCCTLEHDQQKKTTLHETEVEHLQIITTITYKLKNKDKLKGFQSFKAPGHSSFVLFCRMTKVAPVQSRPK